ncbi:MAG: chorismate-binding protein, partial [Rhodoglobus sp.]|nr:chorismate-binding protein [Rhodoglobus sp.]
MRPTVHTASLGRWVDPTKVWAALCSGREAAFWLDSGAHATSGMSYLGVASSLTTDFGGPVLDWLRAEQFAADTSAVASGFALGWVGWLGYELRGETMGVEVGRSSRYPDAAWLFVDRCLAFDHARGEVTLLALNDVDAYRAEVEEALASVVELVETGEPAEISTSLDHRSAEWAYSDAEYIAKIEACQAAIREGDAYQLCLTTEVRVHARPDPFATYLALRQSSPTHHGALLVAGPVAVLSATPEQFLTVSPDGVVRTKPIKGTRARGATPASDAELKLELESSDKERAENLMIVDLMRNDIARVSAVGSVTVTDLMAVESYAQVHQLVST